MSDGGSSTLHNTGMYISSCNPCKSVKEELSFLFYRERNQEFRTSELCK